MTLLDLGASLSTDGMPEQALTVCYEALLVLVALPEAEQAKHAVNRCRCLLNAATCLRSLGRSEEALSALRSASSVLEPLVADHADGPVSEYAYAVTGAGEVLSAQGDPDAGISLLSRGLRVLASNRAQSDDAQAARIEARSSLLSMLVDVGRFADALAVCPVLRMELAAIAASERTTSLMLTCLLHEAKALSALSRAEDALDALRAAATVARGIRRRPADELAALAGGVLYNYGNALLDGGRPDDALVAYGMSLDYRKALRSSALPKAQDAAAATITMMAKAFGCTGRMDLAIQWGRIAIRLRRRLVAEYGEEYVDGLVRSGLQQIMLLRSLGRDHEADLVDRTTVRLVNASRLLDSGGTGIDH